MSSSDEIRERKANLRAAEASGTVADNMEVRLALMQRVHSGEITLGQAQTELARIKRGAKAAGKLTREQAYLGQPTPVRAPEER